MEEKNQKAPIKDAITPSEPKANDTKWPIRKKHLLIGIAIVAVVVFALGVAIYSGRNKGSDENLSYIDSVAIEDGLQSLDETTDSVAAEPSDAVKPLLAELFQGRGVIENPISPPYQVPGYSFTTFINSSDVYGFTVTTNALSTDVAAIDAKFSEAGYTKSERYTEESGLAESLYSSDTTVCGLSYTAPIPTNDNAMPAEMTVTCAAKASYEKVAAIQQPFYAAYVKNPDETSFGINPGFVGEPKITDGTIVGYKRAELGITSAEGIAGAQSLYAISPSGSITFIDAVQEVPQCSLFSSADARNAWAGTECYSASGEIQKVTQ